jgi:hypothetical protein
MGAEQTRLCVRYSTPSPFDSAEALDISFGSDADRFANVLRKLSSAPGGDGKTYSPSAAMPRRTPPNGFGIN